ncbi:MAG: hypothetical protein JO345_03940 [Streptosporangiaceae bacterium]|nr:hypothetical protein [Streptosporangiaceae bacterium]
MPAAPPAVNATTGGSEQAKTAPRLPASTAEIHGTRPRRFGFLLRRIPKTRATYVDPLFARPDLVEHDYYRFRRRLDS